MASPGGVGGADPNITLQAMQEVKLDTLKELKAEQATSRLAFVAAQKERTNPMGAKIKKRWKSSKAFKHRIQKMLKMGEKAGRLLPLEQIKDTAGRFQRDNPELKADVLVLLRQQIGPEDTKEEILQKIQEFYPDVSLADEAFEFLLETTDGALFLKVQEAKEEFFAQFEREIAAGRNIAEEARAAADKGLGTATSMRDLYRDITGQPRDSHTLFDEFSGMYEFKDLKKVIDFMLHSLGADMKSKGPSISHALLHRLLTETRSLQAILGVYRFFKGRMGLMKGLFEKSSLDFPKKLNFELMSKEFMALVKERYPSSDKVLRHAKRLGIEDWLIAKIIAFSQFRDAVREVAMEQIYKSLQHRDELFLAIIEALEDLEDELEELEDQEEEEKEEEEEELEEEE